ncbi:hypothetical protein Q5P01_021672 [Channa striata]|uniref:Uncharacterized protein n=1 Tax=Channa striata TaxID=64152 RepID=A0AA88S0S0_CHASR|nr:hypothetical protein Q5P01_021672 [Channa striata]
MVGSVDAGAAVDELCEGRRRTPEHERFVFQIKGAAFIAEQRGEREREREKADARSQTEPQGWAPHTHTHTHSHTHRQQRHTTTKRDGLVLVCCQWSVSSELPGPEVCASDSREQR